MDSEAPYRPRPQTTLLWLSLAAGFPAVVVALILIWLPSIGANLAGGRLTPCVLSILIVGCWIGFTWAARHRTLMALGTFANMLAALRGGDYSVRARGAMHEDAFGALAAEINELSTSLRHFRVTRLEANALLDKVIETIDIAVFAFDDTRHLRLVNPAGATLLASTPERLLGQSVTDIQLEAVLDGAAQGVQDFTFPGGPGRWDIRQRQFRQDGKPHRLLVVSDLSQPLREEERQAWLRLIRVLGHEINNSLAPVMSLAESLGTLLNHPAQDWKEDMARGLDVIASRAAALNRFMAAYTRLAKMPEPALRAVAVRPLIQSAVRLEQRLPIEIRPGPELTLQADPDQLEQALINLLRNATDAALAAHAEDETAPRVQIGWDLRHTWLEIWITDNGGGLAGTTNLFVPFFTTKPGGSGIGLVLSRQVAEAHHGRLTLDNRRRGAGTEARLYLPLAG